MRRILIVFSTLALLWVIIAQVNHSLSSAHVYLFVGGLYITYGALVLPFRAGLAASILAGLLCDATTPVKFGTHMLLWATAHAIIYNLRDRIPREDTTSRVIVALLANLGLFLVFSFIQISRSPAPASAWPRLIADLFASQIFLILIAPWFFALQSKALLLARVERDFLS